MTFTIRFYFAAFLVFLVGGAVGSARAHWQTVTFDTTKNDSNAYTTDIPADAFTKDGITLQLKGAATYTLTSKQLFTGDFSYELQKSLTNRNESGAISIELVLVNDQKKRRAVGTWSSFAPGSERSSAQYFKDGKAATYRGERGVGDRSSVPGHEGDNSPAEWLRMHKADQRVFFMHKLEKNAYRWNLCSYPPTTYFNEDCDEFQVALVIRSTADAVGTLQIKTLRISGTNVLPRDKTKREFLFDFGPVNQELEDDFTPVSEYTMYSPEKGMGWVIPEPEKIVRPNDVGWFTDSQIAAVPLQSINDDWPGWAQNGVRQSYWMMQNDKKLFYSQSFGGDFIAFFQKYLDLKTPLERDAVGMAKPYKFSMIDQYSKDVEERRGSTYIDDDLSGEFVVDLPNGQYNAIIGCGYTPNGFCGEFAAFNLEVNGRVRKQSLRPDFRRCSQYPIRTINVDNSQMRFRFFCDVRKSMDNYKNHNIGTGWFISYIIILPVEDRTAMDAWEWKIIKRRGDIIRRVAFVEGDPAVTANEGRITVATPPPHRPVATTQASPPTSTPPLVTDVGQNGFLTLNGKPWYFLKLQWNYNPGVTNHYIYYNLYNTLHFQDDMQYSKQFFKSDWEKRSYSDDYPWRLIDQLNTAYSWGAVSTVHHKGILSFVPQSVLGEGNPTVDSRGRRNRYNLQPPLNSALGKEIQKEAFTMMSNQIGTHPDVAGHYIFEELWHPEEAGYDDQSILQYWQWLQDKYHTIDALNKDWGSQYTQWEDILPPVQLQRNEFWQFTPEYVNFRNFRSWAQQQTIKDACALVRKNEPNHFTWGAKGDFGTQSWYPAEYLDGFGWYTPQTAASAARYFGKTAICAGYRIDNEWVYTDGRKQFDHVPGPRKYKGREEANHCYNMVLTKIFKGAKGLWNEWYSDAFCDPFHRTDLVRRDAPKYKIKEWTGQLGFFDPPAFEGPPVKLQRAALYADRANQMLYRLDQLWLPAAPLAPRILVPCTQESFYLSFFGGEKAAHDFENKIMPLFNSAGAPPVDFMALSAVKDFSAYQLIVLGDTSQAMSKVDAQRIRDFVNKGGKLIIMNAGGFSDDTHPRRYWGKEDEVYPLEEFADLGGYRLQSGNAWSKPYDGTAARFVKNDIDPTIAYDTPIGEYTINCYYAPTEGSQVFLKGRLKDNREIALGIINSKKNVAVIGFPPNNDDAAHAISIFFRKLLTTWKIDGRVTMDGIDDAWNMYAGCLTGPDYTLATVCNNNMDTPKTLKLRLNFLPPGNYAVIDVTGEHPDLLTKPDGGMTLKSDPAGRDMQINFQLSAQQLAQQGIPCTVPPRQAQVFLIRPLEQKVWVSIWRPWLQSFVKHPLTIVYGTGPADQSSAQQIQAALAKAGIQATLAAATDIKHKHEHHEVRIDPFKRQALPQDDPTKWFLVDTFDNEVVDTDNNLIVVGSLESNELLRFWTREDSFIYDKLTEKASAKYPGPGRGVIGSVDSINSPLYITQSQSRDAITIGGSDSAGLQAATQEFIHLLTQYTHPDK
ncbi:MAG: beta-galactosidase [Phycisphaerales bacterium]|nr:beta-galactosidase [Phycisphaerales bacterium]